MVKRVFKRAHSYVPQRPSPLSRAPSGPPIRRRPAPPTRTGNSPLRNSGLPPWGPGGLAAPPAGRIRRPAPVQPRLACERARARSGSDSASGAAMILDAVHARLRCEADQGPMSETFHPLGACGHLNPPLRARCLWVRHGRAAHENPDRDRGRGQVMDAQGTIRKRRCLHQRIGTGMRPGRQQRDHVGRVAGRLRYMLGRGLAPTEERPSSLCRCWGALVLCSV